MRGAAQGGTAGVRGRAGLRPGHAGRRPDLSALVRRLVGDLAGLEQALLDQADRHLDTPAPGMTHLQHAQPVLFAHQLAAHVQPLGGEGESTGEAASQLIVEHTQNAERELVTKPVTASPRPKPRGGGQAKTK